MARHISLLSLAITACTGQEFKSAFAQDMDGTLKDREFCRESLAQLIYAPANREKVVRDGNSNVFIFNGVLENYRIYAFKSQSECETVLSKLKLRQTVR